MHKYKQLIKSCFIHTANLNQLRDQSVTSESIFGLVGIINLIAGPYLIVINSAQVVCEIRGQKIYQVLDTKLISFRKTTTHLTETQIHFNTQYQSMIRTMLATPYFYFSYEYDLSHSLQRLHQQLSQATYEQQSPLERADQRFVWNAALLQRLSSQGLHRYCLPLIHGFIGSRQISIRNETFNLTLISRRSVQRAGTRMFMRGADISGHVANFVETEQIVEFSNLVSSFVQIRGSIPLLWSQLPTLKYKPPPQLCQTHNQEEVFQKHFDQLTELYGRVVMISLINQIGQERVLGAELDYIVDRVNVSSLKYEYFDFHHECGSSRWHRLSKLMSRILQDQKDQGSFLMSTDNNLLAIQRGVFRTNCIDSLDRTNVVQNLIAKSVLEDFLVKNNIISAGEKIEHYSYLEGVYRNCKF